MPSVFRYGSLRSPAIQTDDTHKSTKTYTIVITQLYWFGGVFYTRLAPSSEQQAAQSEQ